MGSCCFELRLLLLSLRVVSYCSSLLPTFIYNPLSETGMRLGSSRFGAPARQSREKMNLRVRPTMDSMSPSRGLMETSRFLAMISTFQTPSIHGSPPAYPDSKGEFVACRPVEVPLIDWLRHLLMHFGHQFDRHTD